MNEVGHMCEWGGVRVWVNQPLIHFTHPLHSTPRTSFSFSPYPRSCRRSHSPHPQNYRKNSIYLTPKLQGNIVIPSYVSIAPFIFIVRPQKVCFPKFNILVISHSPSNAHNAQEKERVKLMMASSSSTTILPS